MKFFFPLLILFFFCNSIIYSQKTYVPSDEFESWLEFQGYGDGIALNDSVLTSALLTCTGMNLNAGSWSNIDDFTGIEEMLNLDQLYIGPNATADTLSLQNNVNLSVFQVNNQNIEFLDLSDKPLLNNLYINSSNLKNFTFSNNTILTYLDMPNSFLLEECYINNTNIDSLDFTFNNSIIKLDLTNNNLHDLDLRNGNYLNFIHFDATNNSNLSCISVDDTLHFYNIWPNAIDINTIYSSFCNSFLYGCLDSLACNFSINAIYNDSSCNYPFSDTINIIECDIFEWDGINYSTSGSYINYYTALNGCDSIVTLNLDIIYSPSTSNIFGNTIVNISSNESYSVAQNIGSTFNWFLDGGGIIVSGQNTNSVEVLWGNNANLCNLYVIETGQNGCIADTVFALIEVTTISFIQNFSIVEGSKVINVLNLFGKESISKNQLLFFIHENGRVEKKLIIE